MTCKATTALLLAAIACPAVGEARYLQTDPIGLAGGINTYGYASANPVMRVDPFGLVDKDFSPPWDFDNVRQGLAAITSPQGVLTVGIHFNGAHFVGSDGMPWTIDALAAQIRAGTDLSKYQVVRLYSCRAGAAAADGSIPAQQLANVLGLPVQASNQYVWVINQAVAPYQGTYGKTPDGKIDRSNPGRWMDYRPAGAK